LLLKWLDMTPQNRRGKKRRNPQPGNVIECTPTQRERDGVVEENGRFATNDFHQRDKKERELAEERGVED